MNRVTPGSAAPLEFSVFVTQQLNRILDEQRRSDQARIEPALQEAEDLAIAAAQVGRCSPMPADWREP